MASRKIEGVDFLLVVGVAAALFMPRSLLIAPVYPLYRFVERANRRGWELRPVVVVSRAVSAGRPVSVDDLEQRALPIRFIGQGLVKVESYSAIVNHVAKEDLVAGDALRWEDVGETIVVPVMPVAPAPCRPLAACEEGEFPVGAACVRFDCDGFKKSSLLAVASKSLGPVLGCKENHFREDDVMVSAAFERGELSLRGMPVDREGRDRCHGTFELGERPGVSSVAARELAPALATYICGSRAGTWERDKGQDVWTDGVDGGEAGCAVQFNPDDAGSVAYIEARVRSGH